MLLLVFVILGLVQSFSGQNDFGHLPDETEPKSYILRVEPNFAKETASFTGRVNILIGVKTTTSAITLNSKDLIIKEINVTDVDTNRNIGVHYWDYEKDQERVKIYLHGHVLASRKYTISIQFEGLLRDDGNGFFKSHYSSVSGKRKWLAATQFQNTHARSAFPCYDEPAFRTPFNISLKRNRNEIALSNMPVLSTVDVFEENNPPTYQNRTWVHFMQTPPMSTYLVALFVGEFECIDYDDRQSLTDVYSHLGSLYQTGYIDETASNQLLAMENYTGVKYDLPKLNLLAVPELGFGAVENWGLNIYREKSIFVDARTKTKTKVSAKRTAEHGMAHQWFGNLVTPVWWDFVWLNKGFSTYFEYFATATIEPEWRLEHFFVVEIQQSILEYDQKPRRSLSRSTRTSEEIGDIFDKITYDKGAVVLRMLRNWVGENTFKKALNIYLTRNRYKVVKPEHLWNAFENALIELKQPNLHDENVHTIMNEWTKQAGYPVVNVKKIGNSLVLTQEQFSLGRSNESDTKWFVRSSYTTSDNRDFGTETTPSVWLDPKTNETTVPVTGDVKWYIFNVQSTGFYRVNYTEDNWLSLAKQLYDAPTVIHVLNRAQLIDDSFNLARANKLNYTIPLNLIRYLEKEYDIVPWFSAMNNLNYVLNRMRHNANGYADVKAFVSRLAGIAFRMVNKLAARKNNLQCPIYVGWNAFSTWACRLDNEQCVKTALNYFRRWRNGEEIPADIKDAAFCAGVKYGAAEENNWDYMLALYNSTKTYSEKESALYALTCTEDARLLITQLNLILENRFPIEPQDYDAFFNALTLTPSGINTLTLFLRNNLKTIVENVKEGKHLVTNIYSCLATKISTADEEAKMLDLTTSTRTPAELRSQLYSIYHDEIKYNEKWSDGNSITIREFVNPGSTTTVPSANITTQGPSEHETSSSSRRQHFVVHLQILALSVSIKAFNYIRV